jgi:hypothetical protein
MRFQVTCYQFDPDARLKSWDRVFIAVGTNSIGFGSSRDKALARALCYPVTADDAHKVIPLEGCSIRAVPEHCGRKHAIVISVTCGSFSTASDFIFSFDDSDVCDAFVERLQVLNRFMISVTIYLYSM